MTEQIREKERAETARKKYLELNKETTFKRSIYDPKLRKWHIPVEKFDENASKFKDIKKEPKEVIPRKKVRLVKMKVIKPKSIKPTKVKAPKVAKEKVIKPKIIKPKAKAKAKATVHGKIKQRRDSIFNDYKNGMSKLEMMEKYNIKSDALSRDIRIKCAECNFTPLKVKYNIKKSKNELMCIKLFKKLVSSVLIADQLRIPLGTVKHYRVKYYKSK